MRKPLLVVLLLAAIAGALLGWWRKNPPVIFQRGVVPANPTAVPTPSVSFAQATPPPELPTLPPDIGMVPTPVPLPTPAPSPLPAGTAIDRILVQKAARLMTVYQNGSAVRSYLVALGPSPNGHKEIEGDGRTPEGRYFIVSRNPNSKYHLSLRISYPNARDVAHARTLGKSAGGDIMIHGLPNGQGALGAAHRQIDWTIGCVAVTNEEIEEIWRVVPNGCVVDIEP